MKLGLITTIPGGWVCGWVGGGWSDKMKLILISTLVEVVVKVEVELGNTNLNFS